MGRAGVCAEVEVVMLVEERGGCGVGCGNVHVVAEYCRRLASGVEDLLMISYRAQ